MKKTEEGSWINQTTTRDQQDIEEYLLKNTKDKTILHIGVGNSSLHSRLKDTNNVVGITLYESEQKHAVDEGCIVLIQDKYHPSFEELCKTHCKYLVDIVVDNNPSSYADGREGFDMYINAIKQSLDKGGQFITHLGGMHYAVHNGFSITLDELKTKFGEEFEVETDNNVVIFTKK